MAYLIITVPWRASPRLPPNPLSTCIARFHARQEPSARFFGECQPPNPPAKSWASPRTPPTALHGKTLGIYDAGLSGPFLLELRRLVKLSAVLQQGPGTVAGEARTLKCRRGRGCAKARALYLASDNHAEHAHRTTGEHTTRMQGDIEER